MERSATGRKEMIGQLVEHAVISALAESPAFWMHEIFENGFAGYRQFSDQQLRMEMQLRGLAASPNGVDEDAETEEDEERAFDLNHI